jgi:hypothetical protein
MPSYQIFGAWAFLVIAIGALAFLLARHRHQLKLERSNLLEDCLPLLKDVQQKQEGVHYPRVQANVSLAGRQSQIDLWAMADTLQTRRLPPLWLFVDIRCVLAIDGVMDVLVRPTGVEVFSPSRDLAYRHELLSHWPQASILKSSFPDIEKLLQQLDLPLHDLLADPYTKCLTLRPDGLRYVVQIAQASQAHYMVLRNSHFGPLQVPAAFLEAKLSTLGQIMKILESA